MRQGTTPTFEFELEEPIDVARVANAKVTFSFNGQVILEKYLSDCTFDGKVLTVCLSQEDTFLFVCHSNVKIQLRIVTIEGEAYASDEFNDFVDRCLDDEVLT